MKNFLFALLIITNAATAYELWVSKQRIHILTSQKTTEREREVYGEACLDWLQEEGKETHKREGDFYLGRSWKKHGQLVFEVIGPNDEFRKKNGDPICTYDKQSGMMYSHFGSAKERWMFY